MTKESTLKLVTIGTIISLVLTLVFSIGRLLFYTRLNQAASIGIIGGADGPTAVFIATNFPSIWGAAIFLLLTIIGFILIKIIKKRNSIQ